MGLILHEIKPSPPVRAVKLCLTELDLEVEYKLCNLLEKEQYSSDYVKKNPQHTVPTLEDGDFIIWDSHAINAYLVSVYGKDDSLYPKDPKVRALIDQRLHFDSGVLFPALRNICFKVIFQGVKTIPDEDKKRAEDALEFVEKFLDGKQFITGDKITIADFSIYTTASALVEVAKLGDKFPGINKYFTLCKNTFKGSQSDAEGLEGLASLVHSKLSS